MIIDENIIWIFIIFTINVFFAAGGLVLVYRMALKKSQNPDALYIAVVKHGNVLEMVTVIIIVCSVVFLLLLKLISESSATPILSGVAGYVLGSLGRTKKNNDCIK